MNDTDATPLSPEALAELACLVEMAEGECLMDEFAAYVASQE